MPRGGARQGAGRPKGVRLPLTRALASELLAAPDTKEHWQLLRDSKDERLRFRVECYLWDRAEGEPAQATILADNRESVREVELGDVPMQAAKPCYNSETELSGSLIEPFQNPPEKHRPQVAVFKRQKCPSVAADLIQWLNPKIGGWSNYHRHVVSKRDFSRVDNAIFICLWQWARRRHPKKSPSWLKQKYFEQHGGRNWAFFGESCDDEGKLHKVRLLLAISTPIQRHVKVKSAANPYDPAYETYFEKREGDHNGGNVSGTRSLRFLWRFQCGLCPATPRSPGSQAGAFTGRDLTRELDLLLRWAEKQVENLTLDKHDPSTVHSCRNHYSLKTKDSPSLHFS
jgi:hypothetical protein